MSGASGLDGMTLLELKELARARGLPRRLMYERDAGVIVRALERAGVVRRAEPSSSEGSEGSEEEAEEAEEGCGDGDLDEGLHGGEEETCEEVRRPDRCVRMRLSDQWG